MADISVLFSGFAKKASIDVLELDASIRENHEFESDISENEIEDGSNVADNATLKPIMLNMECIISEAPIGFKQALTSGAGGAIGSRSGIGGSAASGLVTGGLGVLGSQVLGDGVNRRDNAYDKIIELWRSRRPITVVTGLKTYNNMLVKKVSMPRESKNGNSLVFNVTLHQVKIVQSKTVALPAQNTKSKSSASALSQGSQKTTPATANEENNASILRNFWRGLGGR